MSFADYIAHGWRLCAIDPGGKAPKYDEWNARGLGQIVIPPGFGAGLMHSESGTCAIDIDNLPVAEAWLSARGLVLASLLIARTAVRVTSGRTGRAKLLYRLDGSLPSVKTAPFRAFSPKSGKEETYTALDFRCATKGGLSMQDVLPPTIHPDTGKPYTWEYGDPLTGSWRNLPPLPPELRAIWESLLTPAAPDAAPAAPLGAGFDEIRTLLAGEDPNAAYNEWLEVGMALHHETGGSRDGLLLWNEWSSQATGPDKYKGIADLEPHWRSFSSKAAGAVTLGTLRARQVAQVSDFPLVPASTTPAAATGPTISLGDVKREFGFVTGAEAAKAPDLVWLVGTQEKPLIPDAELGFVYGPPKGGKTSWLLDLALHIASGTPWRALPVLQRRVVYLAAEGWGGLRGAKGRYERARTRLQLAEDIPFDFISRPPNFMSAEAVSKVATLLKHIGAKVIVADTLARLTGGADENSSKDMGQFIEYCQSLHRITGAMVLVVAHSGKDETRGMRGSSALDGAADVEIRVSRATDDVRVAEVERMKDGKEGDKYPFRLLEDGNLEHTDEIPRAAPRQRRDAVFSAFHSVCTDATGLTGAGRIDLEDAITAMLVMTPVAPGEAEKVRREYRRKIGAFCVGTDSTFVLENNIIRQRVEFPLRPAETGEPGIDAAPPVGHAHADLMG